MAQGVGVRFWAESDAGGRQEYTGHFVGGQRDGVGRMKFADNTYYEGQWAAGKPQGYGREAYPDGSTYTGQFDSDKRHGLGVYVFADSTVYAGNWSKGLQHGVGIKLTDTEKTVCTFETYVVLLFDPTSFPQQCALCVDPPWLMLH